MIKSVYGRREGWQSIEIAGSAHSQSPAPGKVVRHSTTRSQLVMGRVQVQEQRISTLKGELFNTKMLLRMAAQERERTETTATNVEDAIRSGNLSAERARQLEKELADVKDRLLREQRTESELRYREAELVSTLAIDQNRWSEFNSRLDDLERALSPQR